ncbi:MAG: hypothetical protein GW911_25055 [Armatimonadetes bacterium]|nr:hypothetical protein [Armatimonadota bacterium]NCO93064.1 hypothetical protein [Armatimonadota bacterium]NCP33489.1 hypothetical protein [Armatimonadota bacterium]NCQ28122.1 hypothetical protein [Armatimonadota bacterium]NDK15312.1 hypothetical protein [Armatimonadota bacterium]
MAYTPAHLLGLAPELEAHWKQVGEAVRLDLASAESRGIDDTPVCPYNRGGAKLTPWSPRLLPSGITPIRASLEHHLG